MNRFPERLQTEFARVQTQYSEVRQEYEYIKNVRALWAFFEEYIYCSWFRGMDILQFDKLLELNWMANDEKSGAYITEQGYVEISKWV